MFNHQAKLMEKFDRKFFRLFKVVQSGFAPDRECGVSLASRWAVRFWWRARGRRWRSESKTSPNVASPPQKSRQRNRYSSRWRNCAHPSRPLCRIRCKWRIHRSRGTQRGSTGRWRQVRASRYLPPLPPKAE